MRYRKSLILKCALLGAIVLATRRASAHGFVGDFFFPATITSDDPLVTDELAILFNGLPGGDPQIQDLMASFEFDKVIIPKLALGVSDDYNWLRPSPGAGPAAHGWDNLTLSAKYELWRSDAHNAIISIGMETEIGGTGSQSIGRDSFSTFVPTFYFGKGFGDLPESLPWLRPVAITGTLGLALPTEAAAPDALEWGVALEYNLLYLQQHVQDIGLPEPFKNMIPLVEFTGDSPFDRGGGGTTATINPGVLYESRYYQIGVEALVPVNRDSGEHIGGILQVQIYIDDLFPKLFGSALFGG